MALGDIVSQFQETFKKLTLLQKASVVAAVAAVVISVVVIVYWANRPVYKMLFAGLTQEDAASVIEKLKAERVPYKLEDNGGKITVPEQYVYETRLSLAKEGIPTGGGAGLELFDKSSFGMTEFMQNINYQRALQGELARTISSIKEVAEARVHLTLPKDRLFISDEEEAKASVVLRLRNGENLGREEVKAIAALVSGAVKGLKKENVQIVDTSGRLLSEFLTDDAEPLMLTQTQLEYQRKVEKDLENKVNEILGRTLGQGSAVAKVTADIDFAKRDITKEEYDPNPVLRSQQSLEINSTNSPQTPEGVPGVQSNLAEPDITPTGQNQEYNKSEETQNFEVGKTVTVEQKPYGTIKRVTVAVVVDDKKEPGKDDKGNDILVGKPRTQAEIQSIKNLVSMAVGFNADRKDQVEVTNISFDTTAKDQENTELKREKTMELVTMLSKYALAVVIVLLFYFLVIRRILKKMDKPVTVHEDGSITYGELGRDDVGLDLNMNERYPKSLEELEKEIENELNEGAPLDVETVKSKVMLKKIEEFATEDPEAMANLVKSLLKGD
ncbi:flagellar basal-body MS-ring/collar protein FliF [Seleniivibrio sp.]|uniref:flagellar basal-body MS-ring/collar protein FliF n=1 Tax=Seleniivibrio sp. TaxID=2898801 RepID=UPI0025F55954|nr:flagellar basal-body MS-ring/collar protein FliF [Seleniivibrio sp.]MCD8554568.1 flagellar M-ring protein FliF [Seleniivibrio sp.]